MSLFRGDNLSFAYIQPLITGNNKKMLKTGLKIRLERSQFENLLNQAKGAPIPFDRIPRRLISHRLR